MTRSAGACTRRTRARLGGPPTRGAAASAAGARRRRWRRRRPSRAASATTTTRSTLGAVLENRAYALVHPVGEDDPEVLPLVRHLQAGAEAMEVRAGARHAAAGSGSARPTCAVPEGPGGARRRRTHRLASHRAVAGASPVGHDGSALGPAASVVPAAADRCGGRGVAVAGDTGSSSGYARGMPARWRRVLPGGTGGAAGTLRKAPSWAQAHLRRGPDGRLTAQERLRLGAVAEVRQRRDDPSRRSPCTERGTPSAFSRGPVSGRRAGAAPARPRRRGARRWRDPVGRREGRQARALGVGAWADGRPSVTTGSRHRRPTGSRPSAWRRGATSRWRRGRGSGGRHGRRRRSSRRPAAGPDRRLDTHRPGRGRR